MGLFLITLSIPTTINAYSEYNGSYKNKIIQNEKTISEKPLIVVIRDGDETYTTITNKETVRDLLVEKGLELEDKDRINTELDSKLTDTQEIIIEREEDKKERIKNIRIKIKETERQKKEKELERLLNETIIKGKRYNREIVMEATAYDPSPASNGKWAGVTASGTKLRPGVVAVDPRVVPLGTRLYVESLDEWPDYGFAIAEDTGGAIKGNRIDLLFMTRNEALRFGRRNVKIYVLEE